MVQHDGPISVARSFTAADWRRLIAEAGIQQERIRINRYFPFRLCVASERHEEAREVRGDPQAA
jgi:hypothetical protein